MSNKGRILVLDDSEHWQITLRLLLENEDYYVDVVSNIDEALNFLKNSFYHVAIFDIRLVDSDPEDVQGLELLKDLFEKKMLGDMKIIILSAYGTKEQMRETFSHYEIVDFLEKDNFNADDFIQIIQNAFLKIKINLGLNIDWKFGNAESSVINLKLSNNARVKKDTKLQKLLAIELSDLLQRLFHEADTILVKPLKAGGSGTNVLIVEAFYEKIGGAAPMVVKFGAAKEISVEIDNFKKYVQGFIETGRHAALVDAKYTSRLGGIVYKLLGTSGEHLQSFGQYYQSSTSSEIKETINNLFYGTCHSWYKSPGVIHPINLTDYYSKRMGVSKEKLVALLNGLKIKQINNSLQFNAFPERSFANPFSFIEKPLKFSTYECIIHGDLHGENILVDDTQNTWLIDFGATTLGHFLQDFVELDSVIRFQLLTSEQATLEERLYLEETLSKINSFSEIPKLHNSFKTNNSYLEKAFLAISQLQTLAGEFLPNKKAEIYEYHATLLFYALNTIRFSFVDIAQRQHALLCASILTEKLRSRGFYE